MTELVDLGIREAHRLLVERETSAVELVEATLAVLERTEPLVHAYAAVLADEALAAAEELDRELARRRVRGPLHGIPVGVKDVIDVAGVPTRAGSRALADVPAPADAEVVARLRAAGAVIVGKTVTHEFAFAPERGDGPQPRNPWDLERLPGGSSAGSAVAPVVRSAFAAIGTDTAGSIRGPASWTGLVGLKPTYGLVGTEGVLPLSPSLDHVGPLARTVDDCALVLDAIADVAPARDGRLRVGLERAYFSTGVLAEEVGELVEAAAGLLDAELVEVAAPGLEGLPAAGIVILLAEAYRCHGGRDLEACCPGNRRLLALGERIAADDYDRARAARRRYRDELRSLLEANGLDLLAAPTLPTAAVADASELAAELPDLVRYTLPANVGGQPALSVPCGFTADGLPVGLQLIGRPFDEGTLLAAARSYEDAAVETAPRPPLVPHQRAASSA